MPLACFFGVAHLVCPRGRVDHDVGALAVVVQGGVRGEFRE